MPHQLLIDLTASPTSTTPEVKPLLRWAGSKYNQPAVYKRLQQLWRQMPADSTYVSLFGGGLGDVLRVKPERAIVGDTNSSLIEFYRFARAHSSASDQIDHLEPYLQVRERFNSMLEINSLWRNSQPWRLFCMDFYRLNQTCFNGLWRVNGKGKFNVPEGRNSKGESLRFQPADFSLFQEQAEFWEFYCMSWQKTLLRASVLPSSRPSAMIYADPPYDSMFAAYTKDGFDWQQQVELAQSLAKASALHPVVASNAATDRIVGLYEGLGFTIEIVSCRRSVSCDGNRAKVPEMLAYQGF